MRQCGGAATDFEETLELGTSVARVAQKYGVNANQVFQCAAVSGWPSWWTAAERPVDSGSIRIELPGEVRIYFGLEKRLTGRGWQGKLSTSPLTLGLILSAGWRIFANELCSRFQKHRWRQSFSRPVFCPDRWRNPFDCFELEAEPRANPGSGRERYPWRAEKEWFVAS